MKHYVPLPADLAKTFAAAGVERVTGDLDGHRFRRSLHPTRNGGLCLRFGVAWLKDAGLQSGQLVMVTVAEDPEPDRVDVPDELRTLLDGDPALEHAWETLTPGRQRTLAYQIERAKKADTRRGRAAAVVENLKAELGLR